jgi:hypothetical protein
MHMLTETFFTLDNCDRDHVRLDHGERVYRPLTAAEFDVIARKEGYVKVDFDMEHLRAELFDQAARELGYVKLDVDVKALRDLLNDLRLGGSVATSLPVITSLMRVLDALDPGGDRCVTSRTVRKP